MSVVGLEFYEKLMRRKYKVNVTKLRNNYVKEITK